MKTHKKASTLSQVMDKGLSLFSRKVVVPALDRLDKEADTFLTRIDREAELFIRKLDERMLAVGEKLLHRLSVHLLVVIAILFLAISLLLTLQSYLSRPLSYLLTGFCILIIAYILKKR